MIFTTTITDTEFARITIEHLVDLAFESLSGAFLPIIDERSH